MTRCAALRRCGHAGQCTNDAVQTWKTTIRMTKDGDVQTTDIPLCAEHVKIYTRRLNSKRICYTAVAPMYPLGILPEPNFHMNMVSPILSEDELTLTDVYTAFVRVSYKQEGNKTL